MSFNDNAQLDPGRVNDSRGRSGGKIAAGGGGILVLILAALFGINPQVLNDLGLGGTSSSQSQTQNTGGAQSQDCKTGADADQRSDCRIIGTVQSLDAFWGPYLAKYKVEHADPDIEIFSDAVNTGCGQASSDVGPFYCPADQTGYFDVGFFDLLRDRFGASGGPLAEEYVVAHEYGHHIQNEIGTLQYSQQGGTGPTSGAVRVELQADCFAGLWAAYASETRDSQGNSFLEPFTKADLQDALSAAQAVGDDRIQEASTGRVMPEAWTHGSAAQRQAWFMQGYETGDINKCNTLESKDLNNPA